MVDLNSKQKVVCSVSSSNFYEYANKNCIEN